jgi:uncharacterized membrane protein required for colicin V production
MDSTYIDIFLFTIIGLFSIKGLNSGFISESKGIVALFIALFNARDYAYPIRKYLDEYLKLSPSAMDTMAIILSFISIVIIVYILAFILYNFVIRSGALGFYDRIFGLLFSLSQIVVVLSVLIYSILVFIKISDDSQDFLQDSIGYKYLHKIGYKLVGEYINEDTDFLDSIKENILSLDVIQELDTQEIVNNGVKKAIDNMQNSDNLDKITDEIKKNYLKKKD